MPPLLKVSKSFLKIMAFCMLLIVIRNQLLDVHTPIKSGSSSRFLEMFLKKERVSLLHKSLKKETKKTNTESYSSVTVSEYRDTNRDPILRSLLDNLDLTTNVSFQFLIVNRDYCHSDLKQLFLINVIISQAADYDSRSKIRTCWKPMKWTHLMNYKFIFLIGVSGSAKLDEQVARESAGNGDIIHTAVSANDVDLMIGVVLHWVQQYCRNTKWIVRSNSDTFINLFHLIRILKRLDINGHNTNLVCVGPLATLRARSLFKDINFDGLDRRSNITYCNHHFFAINRYFARKASSFINSLNQLQKGQEEVFLTGVVPLMIQQGVNIHFIELGLNIIREVVETSNIALLFNEALRTEFYQYIDRIAFEQDINLH